MPIKLYEVDIHTENEEDGVYSMVIKADHMPTNEELQVFLKKDIAMYGGMYVELIGEISKEEAENFYDLEGFSDEPVLSR